MTKTRCLACHSEHFTPYAKATDVEYFTTQDIYTYFKCQDCKTLFIDPVPRDLLSTIYPNNYYSFKDQDDNFLLKVKTFLDGLLFRQVLRQIKKNQIAVLDVGGGEGWLDDLLRKADSRVGQCQIVDIDTRAGQRAVQKGHSYFCGRIEDFVSDKKFDLTLMLNLIEHVENPKEVLQKVFNLTDEKGFVLVKTPNSDSLDVRVFRHGNWGGYHCPRHWVLFTMDSFEQMAVQMGFKVVLKKYTQGSPFWSVSVLHWLHKKGFIHLSAEKPATTHPLYPLLSLIFAAFDFIRVPFSKTSQMFFLLQK